MKTKKFKLKGKHRFDRDFENFKQDFLLILIRFINTELQAEKEGISNLQKHYRRINAYITLNEK